MNLAAHVILNLRALQYTSELNKQRQNKNLIFFPQEKIKNNF